jgi:hypothetical protein
VDVAAGGSGRVLLGGFEQMRKDNMRRNRNRNRNRNNNAMRQAQMAEQAAKAAAAAAASVGCSSAGSAAASASSAGAQGIISNLEAARALQYCKVFGPGVRRSESAKLVRITLHSTCLRPRWRGILGSRCKLRRRWVMGHGLARPDLDLSTSHSSVLE